MVFQPIKSLRWTWSTSLTNANILAQDWCKLWCTAKDIKNQSLTAPSQATEFRSTIFLSCFAIMDHLTWRERWINGGIKSKLDLESALYLQWWKKSEQFKEDNMKKKQSWQLIMITNIFYMSHSLYYLWIIEASAMVFSSWWLRQEWCWYEAFQVQGYALNRRVAPRGLNKKLCPAEAHSHVSTRKRAINTA